MSTTTMYTVKPFTFRVGLPACYPTEASNSISLNGPVTGRMQTTAALSQAVDVGSAADASDQTINSGLQVARGLTDRAIE